MPERHKNIAMTISKVAETYALVRPFLATIDKSKAKAGGGGSPLRSQASRAKPRVKAGSSVGRSCERAGKSVVPGRLHGWRTVEVLSANSPSNEPRCTHRRSRGSCQRLKKQDMALTVQRLNKSTVHQLLQRSFSACCTRGNYKYADCGLICGWWPTFLTTPQ